MAPGDRICITRDDVVLLQGMFREMLSDVSVAATRIEGRVIALQSEKGWEGLGADKFYEEMETTRFFTKFVTDLYAKALDSLSKVQTEFEEVDQRMSQLFPGD